jgi:hypothetical protein
VQAWLWATPTRHSIRSIEQVFERIKLLYSLDVHNQIANPVGQLRRYAKRLASRAPGDARQHGAKIEPETVGMIRRDRR